MEDLKYLHREQNIYLENREKINITGIENVESFNEHTIIINTIRGLLTIKGQSLHICKLNIEEGNVKIDGSVDSLIYSNKSSSGSKGKGLLSRMFK